MKSFSKFVILSLTLSGSFATERECAPIPNDIKDGNLGYIASDKGDEAVIGTEISHVSEVSELTRMLVILLGEANSDCRAESMATVTFSAKSTGKVYEAHYSTDDYCDGGNSVGYVSDEFGKPVAIIGDGGFYPICVFHPN